MQSSSSPTACKVQTQLVFIFQIWAFGRVLPSWHFVNSSKHGAVRRAVYFRMQIDSVNIAWLRPGFID